MVQLKVTGPATDAVQSAAMSGTAQDLSFAVTIDGTVPVDLAAQIADSSGVTEVRSQQISDRPKIA